MFKKDPKWTEKLGTVIICLENVLYFVLVQKFFVALLSFVIYAKLHYKKCLVVLSGIYS